MIRLYLTNLSRRLIKTLTEKELQLTTGNFLIRDGDIDVD